MFYTNVNSNTNANDGNIFFQNEFDKLKNKEKFIKYMITFCSFVAVIFATLELIIVTKIGLDIKPMVIFGLMLLLSVYGIMAFHAEEKVVKKAIDDFLDNLDNFNMINSMKQFANFIDPSKVGEFVNMFNQGQNQTNFNGFANNGTKNTTYKNNNGYKYNSQRQSNGYQQKKEQPFATQSKSEPTGTQTQNQTEKPKRMYIKDTPFEKEFDVLGFKGCVPPEYVLKKRYKELVKQYHPDVCQGSDVDPYKIIDINESFHKLEKFYKDKNIK